MRTYALVAAAVVLSVPAAARAQTEAEAEIGPRDAGAEAAYEDAFDAMLAGDLDAAIAGFERTSETAEDPDRRAAARELARLARELDARGARIDTAGRDAEPSAMPEADRPDAGRIQFVASTTTASLYAGIALALLLDIDSDPGAIAFATGVTGLGFGAGLAGSPRLRLTQGIADAYSFGLLYGGANAFLLAPPLDLGADATVGMGIAGLALGGVAAHQFARLTDPTPGQVRFTSNMAAFGAATAALGYGTIQPDFGSDGLSLLVLGGLNAGTFAGMTVARGLDWSRSRADLVWLSSGLGALTGEAAGLIIISGDRTSGDGETRGLTASTLAGMWAGFGLGSYFTRNMKPAERFRTDADADAAPVAVAPMAFDEGGGGLSLSGAF